MPVIAILSNKDIIFHNARVYSSSDCDYEIFCDILLVMPEFNAENFKISTKIAIIYGDLGFNCFRNVKYDEIIVYGMSSKSTVTISSSTSSEILIAIQREITDFSDNIIEIGERLFQNFRENTLETLALSILFIITGN
ncbi:MAG: hypothetical protein R3Y09_06315 [Clostridia bacterium]